MTRRARVLGAFLLWLLALVLLRLQFLLDLRVDPLTAFHLGLRRGLLADLLVLLLLILPVLVLRDLVPRLASLGLMSLLFSAAWFVSLCNLFYFRAFDAPLEWWVVTNHLGDFLAVLSSANGLVPSPLILLSTALAVAAPLLALRGEWADRPKGLYRRLARDLTPFFLFMLLWASYSERRTHLLATVGRGTVFDDHVLERWIDVGLHDSKLFAPLPGPGGMVSQSAHDIEVGEAGQSGSRARRDPKEDWATLAKYRAMSAPDPVPPYAAHDPADPPLLESLDADPAATAKARATLGLPAEGPVNVVILFVESFRYYDYGLPVVGPGVFPRLHALMAKNGLLFTQAYTSSLEAGQSARGIFSTICSFPDVVGATVFLGQPYLKERCLPQVMRDAGYHTLAISDDPAEFHNMGLFARLHGVEDYYDKERLTSLGAVERMGGWHVIPDQALFRTALPILHAEEEAGQASARPFYATIATGGTHFPVSEEPGGELPAEVYALADKSIDPANYRGFLSRFRLADEAIAPFIEKLFAEPGGGRTLVVLMGDHATWVAPGSDLTDAARSEYRFRILLGLLTRDMPAPGVRSDPVHQYDVAPTIARVVGAKGKVTWVGHDILAGPGVPWFYLLNGLVTYRLPERACYYTVVGGPLCMNIPPGADPLYDSTLTAGEDDPATREFFAAVAGASVDTISGNSFP